PNFNTIKTSSRSNPPPFILGSTTLITLPSFHSLHTCSANTKSSGPDLRSMGLRPHTTSSKSSPNTKTSEPVVARPVLVSSGASRPEATTFTILNLCSQLKARSASVRHEIVNEEEVCPTPAPAHQLNQIPVTEPADAGDFREEFANALFRVTRPKPPEPRSSLSLKLLVAFLSS
ncbi:long-chain base (LCB) kinase 1, partial [Striga asiatica]